MKRKKFLISIAIVLFLVLFLYLENNMITVTKIEIESDLIPEAFDGYRIVQISDLHSKKFGNEQVRIIKRIDRVNPNMIVITGDLVDSKNYDEEASLDLIRNAVKIAPTYFVTGNHEWWSGKFDLLEKEITKEGVKILRNTSQNINKDGESIVISGIDDPCFTSSDIETSIVKDEIKNIISELENDNKYKILLAHRPEMFSIYGDYSFNLVFSGHAHGGQVRIPFVGGVVAPNQGFFPKYSSGVYEIRNTKMIVSRGLGNSIIPQRIFNLPEIVVVTLLCK